MQFKQEKEPKEKTSRKRSHFKKNKRANFLNNKHLQYLKILSVFFLQNTDTNHYYKTVRKTTSSFPYI